MKISLDEILLCKEIGINQREVPNFKALKIGSIVIYYSYDTIIGFYTPNTKLCVTENMWGTTTDRHLNMISEKKDRLPRKEFLNILNNTILNIEILGGENDENNI